MARKVVISLSPTFGKEVLQENERALQLQVFDVEYNIATKITTEQLISKEGCLIQFEIPENKKEQNQTADPKPEDKPLEGEVVGDGSWPPAA
jgi:hypothetical protein